MQLPLATSITVDPLVSIVTVTYNSQKYLEHTIRAVFAQNHKRIELIVIDGRSTDDTLSIIKSFSNKITYWSTASDSGPADAINKGFAHATGDIFAWLNSDDLLFPETVATVVRALSKHHAQFTYGHSQLIDADGVILKNLYTSPQTSRSYRYDNGGNIFQATVFFKKELWQKYGPLDTKLKCAFEYKLFDRFFKHGKGVFINKMLAQYRIHDQTISARSHAQFPVELLGFRPHRTLAPVLRLFFKLLRLLNWIIRGNIWKGLTNR